MADLLFLLRYRDLIASTLEEHRKIIAEHGYCWWGWWRRPTEGERTDFWGPLQAELASHPGGVPIGLFDSGHGKVTSAQVAGLLPPGLPLPEAEWDRVPGYYRRSPFSAAWIKLTSIEGADVPDFLKNYSYLEAPPLPGFGPELLKRFASKRIQDWNELRSMDTTLWRIRRAQQSDRREPLYVAVQRLHLAVSRQIRELNGNVILHITDPHFASGTFRHKHVWRQEGETSYGQTRQSLADAIAQALGEKASEVGGIVCTGDLTFTNTASEFREASAFLNHLCGVLNVDRDCVVVIPGNHDVKWTHDEAYSDDAPVSVAPEEATEGYRGFHRNFYGHEPEPELCMGRRYQLPCGLTLEIGALNSNALEQGKNFLAGMGRTEEGAFAKVENELGWQCPDSLALRLLAIHHHLALVEDLEWEGGYYRGFGLAIDAPRVLRLAAKANVQLVLHGHKHRQFLWRSAVYENPEDGHGQKLGDISIIGGGSAGSIETKEKRNFFSLLSFTSGGAKITPYRATNAGKFEAQPAASAKLSIERGRLKMADWEAVPKS